MKIISFRKINKKFFIYLFVYIIIDFPYIILKTYIKNNESNGFRNLLLNNLIDLFCFNFSGIFEYIRRTKSSKNESKSKKKEKEHNKIIYIYNFPKKSIKYKGLSILIILIIELYLIGLFLDIIRELIMKNISYVTNEYFNIMDIVYLSLIFRIMHKMIFYKHQILFLVIIILMELIKYISQLVSIKNINFTFPNDLQYLITPIVAPFFDSLLYYIPKYYMEYNYYSPFFIVFMYGIIYTILSLILLIIFLNIGCEGLYICDLLFKGVSISDKYLIIFYIIKSILNAIRFFIEIKFIYDFTVFHIVIFIILKVLFSNIIEIIFNRVYHYSLIIIIITSFFEIFAISVFVEIIELNFCGLNQNLKMNIMNRANTEINLLIGQTNDSDISSDMESSEQAKSSDDSNSNSVY